MLGKRLRELRENLGMTKEAVAKAAHVDRSYIGQLEDGKKDNPSIDVLASIARALEVDVEDLLQAAGIGVGVTVRSDTPLVRLCRHASNHLAASESHTAMRFIQFLLSDAKEQPDNKNQTA